MKLSDIPDEHPVRAFVIETGNIKDGFQKACEHIAALEQGVEDAEGAAQGCHSALTKEVKSTRILKQRLERLEEVEKVALACFECKGIHDKNHGPFSHGKGGPHARRLKEALSQETEE